MSLKILKPGLLASIQDLGRYGFQKYGVVDGGAMDALSLRLANLLVGNQEGEAAIEITMMGTSLQFERDTLIAITGGNLLPKINGKKAPMWRPIIVREEAILEFQHCHSGCRAYIAIAGGLDVAEVMNSKSTYLRGALGGYKGRALKAGDRLLFHPPAAVPSSLVRTGSFPFAAANWRIPGDHIIGGGQTPIIRVIKGTEFDQFSIDSREQFFSQRFTITPQSDRMGYRLTGPNISLHEPANLLSEAVTNGTIQVPPDGQPIILLADRQTTGGYPRIAQIALIDLPVVAQLTPGTSIHFQEISLAEAERLHIEREQNIDQLKIGLSLKMCGKEFI